MHQLETLIFGVFFKIRRHFELMRDLDKEGAKVISDLEESERRVLAGGCHVVLQMNSWVLDLLVAPSSPQLVL